MFVKWAVCYEGVSLRIVYRVIKMLELTLGKLRIAFTFSFFAVIGFVSAAGGEVQKQLFIILLCSLMHEMGHITAMCAFGLPPESITFYVGGIRLSDSSLNCSKPRRAVILLAGCAVDLLSAGVSLILGYRGVFAAAHLLLGLFNLLPFRYFDGGRLYSELTGKDPPVFIRIAALLPLALLALYSALNGELPVSLIAACVLIILDG